MRGPLLYALFISKLGSLIDSKHLFYADNLVIYLSCSLAEMEKIVSTLNCVIIKIDNWCADNFLKLNPGKTKTIIFGSSQHLNSSASIIAPKITVNRVTINCVVT